MRFFTLEQNHESHYRELERAKLHAVSSSLPQFADSARYILAQLLAETKCLVCGTIVPQLRERWSLEFMLMSVLYADLVRPKISITTLLIYQARE